MINWQKIAKKFNIIEKSRKILKNFLVYFYDFPEQENINEVIIDWFKDLVEWIINVFLNGILINLPLYILLDFQLSLLTIIGYGIGLWIGIDILNNVVRTIKR